MPSIAPGWKTAATLLLLAGLGSSPAALLMEDAVTHVAVGANLGSAAPWGNSSSQVKVAAGNLVFPGLSAPTNAGNLANLLGTAGGSSYRAFTGSAVTGGTVYYSFLLQSAGTPGPAGGYLTGLLPAGTTSPGGSSDPLAVYYTVSGDGYQMGLRKSGTSTLYAPHVLTPNATHLVVVKYAFGAGPADDTVSLFLNPDPGTGEPPAPNASQSGGTDAASLQQVYLKSSSGYGAWNFDTLRVGTTWSDVVPSGDGGAPGDVLAITDAFLAPEGMVLRGTNGPPAGSYQVLTSTNLALPDSYWPAVGTYAFDGGGHFNSTNPVQPGADRQFFRLLVGGTRPPAYAPPSITTQPQSLTVDVGANASFVVGAGGTAPLSYRWTFNTNTPVGGDSPALSLAGVTTPDAGRYRVIITNDYGAVTSSFATLTVSTAAVNDAQFDLVGFAWTTTGGGMIPETSPSYAKVSNALDLALAVDNDAIKVIEIMNDLDLGWLEIGAAAQAVGPFRSHAAPSLHPRLLQTGVSLLDIQGKDGLTIFSAHGATIRHCCFNIKNARNVILRNLKFDELWEWDEATKGNYDSKDWDFIDLGNGGGTGTTTNIWIDHCTFTKAYDGICDIKGGAHHITFSWNRYLGDDGATNPNSFVWQQINALESNRTSYPMYNSLRTSSGLTPAEIVTIVQGHDKTHLAGANDGVNNPGNAAVNALHSITFHHQWFQNCWDRCVPRLRAGNVHNFNIHVDNTLALDAKRLRDAHPISSSYNFNPFLNGSISTEGGALLVENSIYQDCLAPLRNNQTDPSDPAYTGKILAVNSIYSFRTTAGTTNYYQGSSTNDPGRTYFGPAQAPVVPFSWNLPGGVLPYPYTHVMVEPTQLQAVLTNATQGCGAGVLNWTKTNWLKTAYPPPL